MAYLWILLFSVTPLVNGQVWSTYGLGYTGTDEDNGIWTHSYNGYQTSTVSRTCSGCSCGDRLQKEQTLEGCSGSASVNQYTFTNISSETFDVSTTQISFRSNNAFEIIDKTFVNLTSLTKLTIQNCGITTMPDISNTQITILNLMNNNIEIKTNYRGTLPSTITHVALTGNKIYWIPNGFLNGPNLRIVSLGGNSFINFPVSGFGSLPSLIYFGIETNSLRRISVQHIDNFIGTSQMHL